MGVYLVQYLLETGWTVDVTSRSVHHTDRQNLRYVQGNAKDRTFLYTVLDDCRYDAIVDFMVWSTDEFQDRYELLESHTDQYVFLSSYRVFDDAPVINEESSRLLDSCRDKTYLRTDEYGLAKARQEDLLRDGKRRNWTIIHPSITYSKARFQLCTLECEQWLWRALRGKAIPLNREMLGKQTTLTWAGDAARFIAALTGNKMALGESYNVVTSEHHTWQEILDLYNAILPCPVKIKPVALHEYIHIAGGEYQVRYDRMFDRVLDNRKVLSTTGIRQDSLKSVRDGLSDELRAFLVSPNFRRIDPVFQARADKATGECTYPFVFGGKGAVCYVANRFVPDTIKKSLKRLLQRDS